MRNGLLMMKRLPDSWARVSQLIHDFLTASPESFADIVKLTLREDKLKSLAFITGLFIGLGFNELYLKEDAYMNVLMHADFQKDVYADIHYAILALTFPYSAELQMRRQYYEWVLLNISSISDDVRQFA